MFVTTLYIRQERIKREWTQEYVGKMTGLTKQSIHDIENDKTKPSYSVLVKLENLFGCGHRQLFGVVDDDYITPK